MRRNTRGAGRRRLRPTGAYGEETTSGREFAVLDFTNEVAAAYGEIVRHAGFSRRKIVDRMIAATGLVHDMTLVTFNDRDFRDVPGLKLIGWERPA